MANRRMFSKAIVGSARFLKMPVDSQSLYFHLGMAADDDGVVEAWSVLNTTRSSEDNLRVLVSKGLIKVLNEDLVSYIMDWNDHNEIRTDRLVPSKYRELLVEILPEVDLKEPRIRADVLKLSDGRPLDNQRTEEVRLGKVSITSEVGTSQAIEIVKDSPKDERVATPRKYPNSKVVFDWFPKPERSWSINTTELKHAELLFLRGEKRVKGALNFLEENEGHEYIPKVTKPSDLERKWVDILNFKKKYNL